VHFFGTPLRKNSMAYAARDHHESRENQEAALHAMRDGRKLTSLDWNAEHRGFRLAPAIERLRNAHGFSIHGSGAYSKPYFMKSPYEMPGLVAITPEVQDAYYETDHWRMMSQTRKLFDDNKCVLCHVTDADLQVHHVKYKLFSENISELMTLCKLHHKMIHEYSKPKFPSGISAEHFEKITGKPPVFDEWLLPPSQ
jgi:hypothetical protein